MDGLKKRLNDSVQFRLSFTLSLVILMVASVAGIFSFLAAFEEAHELQDDVLRQMAQLMEPPQRSRFVLPAPATSPAADPPRNTDEEARIIVQHLGMAGSPASTVSGEAPLAIPATLPDGLHTLMLGGMSFRVQIKTTRSGERIAVAQATEFRNEIARDGALRTVMPFLVLIPLLLLIVALRVRQIFRPMIALAQEIDQRTEAELHPVEAHPFPLEVRPFAIAINRLLGRVDQAMTAQRRFVADAAHELRSPLTALSLQAERLADLELPALAQQRLALLRQGIERNRTLLEQLLSLARAQSATTLPPTRLSLQGIYRRVLEDLMPLAEARHIDLGVESEQDVTIQASEQELLILLRNLVDNALRYTPEGGRVDLILEPAPDTVTLRIRDNGPGIPPAERERVFDPFYRILGNEQTGSGLGLSIVQTIARRIGASLHLTYTDPLRQTGLDIHVTLPMR